MEMFWERYCRIVFFLFYSAHIISGTLVDITQNVFASRTKGIIAAFGDFNSDKLTDIFVLTEQGKRLQVFLANEESPYLRPSPINCTISNGVITSVVPADFNGDSRMDVLITLSRNSIDEFSIFWGSQNALNCTDEEKNTFSITGQPLIFDYNGDKIPDILGENEIGQRQVWLSSTNGTFSVFNISTGTGKKFRSIHSHSSVDLNKDLISDLVLTTETGFEIWYREKGSLTFKDELSYDNPPKAAIIGQSVFIDADLDGVINHLIPVCYDLECINSFILMWDDKTRTWTNVGGSFEKNNTNWGFVPPAKSDSFGITLRVGDFDLDGYPDFLAVLKSNSKEGMHRAFLIQNVPCEKCSLGRAFQLTPDADALSGFNNVVLAAFYDVYNDGGLDVLLVTHSNKDDWSMVALQNIYDSNSCFMKIIVLSGLCYTNCEFEKVPYGVNQPGPTICYEITKSDGKLSSSCAGQLSQSAHFALQLPYTVFGLGHTPNFVDRLKVGVAENVSSHNLFHEWSNLIPNSQMFVIPNLSGDHNRWINKLFVTPSHQVLMTFAALCGVMALILVVILGLHLKEKKEDKREKLKESHRFHFDAM